MKRKIMVDKKRLTISVLVFLVIIAGIVLIAKNSKKEDKNITDGNITQIDGEVANSDSSDAYDGNPYNVPQEYTTSISEFVGVQGEDLSDGQLSQIKKDIEQAFRDVPVEKLFINANMDNVKIIFNKGTTKIADSVCLVFAAYEQSEETLNYLSKYAMSLDTKVLYKYDSDKLIFNMLEK